MKRETRLEELFGGLQPPGAPPELRRRSLEAARRAPVTSGAVDVWTRVWASRTARWAWASAVTVLLLANVGLSLRPAHLPADSTTSPFLIAGLPPESDLAELAYLHPLRSDRPPMVGGDDEPRMTLDNLDPERS